MSKLYSNCGKINVKKLKKVEEKIFFTVLIPCGVLNKNMYNK